MRSLILITILTCNIAYADSLKCKFSKVIVNGGVGEAVSVINLQDNLKTTWALNPLQGMYSNVGHTANNEVTGSDALSACHSENGDLPTQQELVSLLSCFELQSVGSGPFGGLTAQGAQDLKSVFPALGYHPELPDYQNKFWTKSLNGPSSTVVFDTINGNWTVVDAGEDAYVHLNHSALCVSRLP